MCYGESHAICINVIMNAMRCEILKHVIDSLREVALRRAFGDRCTAGYSLLGWLLGLLGEEHCLNVGQHTTLSDGDSREQLVELLVIADSKLQVTWDDPALLVVTGSVSCQLEHLSCEVLHDGSQVHWCASSNSLCIVSLSQVTVDTSHRELEASTAAPGLALALGLATLSASRHDCLCEV